MQKDSRIRRALVRTSMISVLSVVAIVLVQQLFETKAGFCDVGTQPVDAEMSVNGGQLPNIIIINTDDLGYGDVGCYGNAIIRTPNIDRLAQEGMRFTDFYACNALCSPSRFGLLTGRYPQRVGMHWVLWPEKKPFKDHARMALGRLLSKVNIMNDPVDSEVDGMPENEITIAEALKGAGYRTGMVGKWHLGDFVELSQYNPRKHGFDSFFGVPYSNGMTPFPLCRNEEIIDPNIEDLSVLTGIYTKEATDFIEKSKNSPFFLYFAHTYPHQPLDASKNFFGKSRAGRYGDTVEEIDWSVGQILDCLEEMAWKTTLLSSLPVTMALGTTGARACSEVQKARFLKVVSEFP